ncbi:MAG: hypothetical protein JWM80_6683 [Cyanobacteria bacterium RYN_339]|nr:hypothetical protein [Cyanobacteria bacterium RYN_339]
MLASTDEIWLHRRPYDLAWYGLFPFVQVLAMAGAACCLGPRGYIPLYMVSSILTGWGHNWITWLMLLPQDGRKHYEPGTFFWPFVISVAALVPIILTYGTPVFGFAVMLHVLLGFYHITRQHQGLMHAYDGRYMQAGGPAEIRGFSRDARWLLGTAAVFALVWKMVGEPVALDLGAQEQLGTHTLVQLPFPHLPVAVAALVALFGLALLARLAWQAYQLRRTLPLGHLVLLGGALFSYGVATALPPSWFLITYSIVSTTHNVQSFSFCYTHHHLRATAEPSDGLFSRFARERRWWKWGLVPVGLAVSMAAVLGTIPAQWQVTLAFWFMAVHYLVEGTIWRRKHYPAMGRFSRGLVVSPPGQTAPEVAA